MGDPERIDRLGWRIIGIVLVLAAIVTYVKFVRPVVEAEREAEAFRQAVAILSGTEGSLAGLRSEVALVAEELGQSEARLPRSLDVDAFLDELGRIAGTSGVHVESMVPGEVKERPLFRELRMGLRAVGDFPDVYRFLSTLERADQLARIERLNIVATRGEAGCAADLSLVLYYAPPAGS